jgi:glycerol uptake facilitator-like aquaporin
MEEVSISRKLVAELLGTMGLVIAVIGSVTLVNYSFQTEGTVFNVLVQGIAAAFVLFAMIEALGKISGGHFNPAVTIAMIVSKDISAKNGAFYMIAQILGGLVAAVIMIITFTDIAPSLVIKDVIPDNIAFYAISEFLCVFMLVTVVFCCVRNGSKKTSLAVGAFVGGMIMCTASTFYANPAVDIARIFTTADCAISPVVAGVYILAAIGGAIVAAFVLSWLYPKETAV